LQNLIDYATLSGLFNHFSLQVNFITAKSLSILTVQIQIKIKQKRYVYFF